MSNLLRRFAISLGALAAVLTIAALALCPAAADDYAVGAERQIANVTCPVTNLVGQTSIAAGPGTYLAVWSDNRTGSQYDVYGIFLDQNGEPVSDESFLITCDAKGNPNPMNERRPSVAFNGTNFLVVWDAAPAGIQKIYGARVTPSGQVLDPNGFEISAAQTDHQLRPVVASNGLDWQVVWQLGGYGSISSILSATVSGVTRAITKRATLASAGNSSLSPAIAWNGLTGTAARYFVVWEMQGADSDIVGCRIDHLGNKIIGSDVLVSNKASQPANGAAGAQFAPKVAGGLDANGTAGGWMVVWEDAPGGVSGAMSDVRATRISTTGAVQDPGGILLFSEYGQYYTDWNYYSTTPDVAWNGQSYQVVCSYAVSTRRPWGRTVGYNGALGTARQLSSNVSCSQNGMAIAGKTGTYTGSVLSVEYSGSSGIWGCHLNSSGMVTGNQTISLAKQDQQSCASVWNGSNHVVVWADKRASSLSSAIYAARVQSDGTTVDPVGKPVSSAYVATQPAIAWSPTANCYLVVWRQGTALSGYYDIKGKRLDANLNPVGSEITISSLEMDRGNPAVAWTGTDFMVVWADNRALDGSWDIYGKRVSASGVPSVIDVYVTTAPGLQILPSIAASSSGNCLVAWQDQWQMRYEYAIGTTFKGTNVRGWTTVPASYTVPIVGIATEVTATGLMLQENVTYYISVRATNRAGQKSSVGCSDGIKIVKAGSLMPPKVSALSVPSTPEVWDDGDTQTSRSTLHATWSESYDSYGEPATVSKIVPPAGPVGVERIVNTTSSATAEPKIASDGTNYMVVWTESYNTIKAARFNASNTKIGSDITITTSPAIGSHPSVAWDGSKYVVAWEERRSAASTKTDIYAARVSSDGTLMDSGGGIRISNTAQAETAPVISAESADKCMAFYITNQYSINRLRAREFWTTELPPPEYSLEDAKQLPNGTEITIVGLPVTAGNDQFAGVFYIEDKQRIQGIKVVWNQSTISEGMVVTVSGTISTVNGERQINATSVKQLSQPQVLVVPFGIRPEYMGGAAAGIVPGVVGGTLGARGANNIGLLVRTWGVVQNAANGYFELMEPNGEVARVKTPFALPTVGSMYAATGISSCEAVTGGYGSLLLVRKASDVQFLH
ncbi:MAG: hypothetical protein ACOX3G_06220 [Armatimonadota bacterium]